MYFVGINAKSNEKERIILILMSNEFCLRKKKNFFLKDSRGFDNQLITKTCDSFPRIIGQNALEASLLQSEAVESCLGVSVGLRTVWECRFKYFEFRDRTDSNSFASLARSDSQSEIICCAESIRWTLRNSRWLR